MIIYPMTVFGILLALLSLSLPTHSFCIYSDFSEPTLLSIHQYTNYEGSFLSKFSALIPAGGMSCCNFNNRDCNKAGTNDALTGFIVYTNPDALTRTGRTDVHFPSGGYARIGGDPHRPTVNTFDAAGNPFVYIGPTLAMVDD